MKYGVVLLMFFNILPSNFKTFSFLSSRSAIWRALMTLLGDREGELLKSKEFWRATSATVIPGWCCPFVGMWGRGVGLKRSGAVGGLSSMMVLEPLT